ncbi:MAG TPA: hypothetical protein VL179_04180, partial [Mycobacterium sp.]|nr:hypothetical protein [Mycobacterium sp.]
LAPVRAELAALAAKAGPAAGLVVTAATVAMRSVVACFTTVEPGAMAAAAAAAEPVTRGPRAARVVTALLAAR